MAPRARKAGEFCWINILTPQPAEARGFFGTLLGWTYLELPGGMGSRVQVAGEDVGGLFDLAAPGTPPGTPPGIGVMVLVEDADATCAKVKSLGGSARPAFDIMDQGRMAVCHDPNGANFDLWQPLKSKGMGVEGSEHGAPSWFETITTDVNRAQAFYSALFGWTVETTAMERFTYTSFKLGDSFVAGMMPRLPDMPPFPPHWGTYFTVTNVDDTARQAVDLGGQLLVPVADIPRVGRFCGVVSPQGVTFYAITYAR